MAHNNRKKKKPETTVAMATARQQQQSVVVEAAVAVAEERTGNRSKKRKDKDSELEDAVGAVCPFQYGRERSMGWIVSSIPKNNWWKSFSVVFLWHHRKNTDDGQAFVRWWW
mmetsp:Transcript_1838/g.2100  ORF Transcript_1838/g.2100 Transcript_1838/m.2100 type:complete len:112 (+) Transcript_1838:98-433(+)